MDRNNAEQKVLATKLNGFKIASSGGGLLNGNVHRHSTKKTARIIVIFYWLEANMKTRSLIAAVIAASAFAIAGSTIADVPSEGPIANSTKSRAEVRAELEQARKDGLLMYGERDNPSEWIGAHGVAGARYSTAPGRTREEVRAEAIEHNKTFKSGSDDMYGR